MNAADYVVRVLETAGVDTVFGYQGANIVAIIDAIDSIAASGNIRYFQMYHEQATAFAACAHAQIRGQTAAAVSSSGPAFTNMLTGIANAYCDSIPCLFITGNNPAALIGKNNGARQNAFQDVDVAALAGPVTKFAATVTRPADLAPVLARALREAASGRQGPTLVDIPLDIQAAEIEAPPTTTAKPDTAADAVDGALCRRVARLFASAKRPLILLGGGMHAVAGEVRRRFLERFPAPVIASLCGLDLVDHARPGFLGMIGRFGLERARRALSQCDVLFVLGSRLDERQTDGADIGAKIIHVDIDPRELGRSRAEAIAVRADLAVFVEHMLAEKTPPLSAAALDWWRALPVDPIPDAAAGLHSAEIGYWLDGFFGGDDIICLDVGLHQMGLARRVKLSDRNRLLNSGGLGSMGYALPAAIGAWCAAPERRVWCVTGDGGLQMNIQELQTVRRENIPLKLVVVNNNSLGMVRDIQHRALGGRTVGSVAGYSAPDFRGIAAAYGIRYLRAATPGELAALRKELDKPEAVLLEVVAAT